VHMVNDVTSMQLRCKEFINGNKRRVHVVRGGRKVEMKE
jgi:hypothetical protein